jgi:hypothetical protein
MSTTPEYIYLQNQADFRFVKNLNKFNYTMPNFVMLSLKIVLYSVS